MGVVENLREFAQFSWNASFPTDATAAEFAWISHSVHKIWMQTSTNLPRLQEMDHAYVAQSVSCST